ncbi:hypothetical protein ACFE04_014131 [Oxalis oulophora]
MDTVVSSADKRKYSWWWDSHISPKNSKWLQENLTGMDIKVKQMIKLIDEDADSFARRAEMYYKKRPELMKLVEEFYRAYRALAERYDNATGIIHQANRTMSEAFPNQVPFMFADDPLTPDMPSPVRSSFQHEDLQKNAPGLSSSHFHAGKRNGAYTEDNDSVNIKKGLKQLNDLFGSGEAASRARKGLKFDNGENTKQNGSYESARVSKAETEIQTLKNALAKLQSEKEAGLLQYQQSMERLSNLESEFSRAQEDSREKTDRAIKAETEVQTLKENLAELEAESEANLARYQNCVARLSNLENNFSHAQQDTARAENEAQVLNRNLASAKAEKEVAIIQYNQCLEKISNLENNLQHAVEDAKKFKDQAEKAESELEALKRTLPKLMEEKNAAALLYQGSLETISCLEHKLAVAEEETKRLNLEMDDNAAKLKCSEEKCLLLEKSNETFQSELESLEVKLGAQNQELTEKHKELGRLWSCIQEEHLRFVEAETAFQTLQHLHSQSQEKLRSTALELQTRTQILKELEARNQSFQDEVVNIKEENKNLNELNLSSAVSIENLEADVLSLKEKIQKLEAEVEHRVDERNALQQEIYCLKEELNDLINKHQAAMDENSKLKNDNERDGRDKIELLEKLDAANKLIEIKAILENSLSDLTVELEDVRGKVKELEESHRSLMAENSTFLIEKETLISQLQVATETLERLSERNSFLENSLFDVNAEIEGLRVKFNSLGDSYVLLDNEKSNLITERDSLASQLEISRKRLEDLEEKYEQLQEEYSVLEKQRESTLEIMEELKVELDTEKQEHDSFVKQSGAGMANMELQINNLQQECERRKKEYEEEQEKAVDAQFEIFVLQKCIQDLEEKNFAIHADCQKLLEASIISTELISELEHEKLKNNMEIKSLFDQVMIIRMGLHQLFKTLEIETDNGCENSDQMLLDLILDEFEEMRNSLLKNQEENHQLVTENSVLATLLRQLKLEAENLVADRNNIDQEFRKLASVNEELRSKVMEADEREENLKSETKCREEILISELQEGRKEVEMWEFQAITLFGELQFSSIHEALFEGKTRELAKTCEHLNDGISARSMENDQLKQEVDTLENENRELRAQLAAYIPAVIPLRDCVTSLENHIHLQNKLDEEAKDSNFENHLHSENFKPGSHEDPLSTTTDGFSELHNLQTRIKAIEKAVMEMEKLAMLENLNANSKLEEAVRQLKEVKHDNRNSKQGLEVEPVREISREENEVITKDIMLDQISECSSHGISRRRNMDVDYQMLDSWETPSQGPSFDVEVGKVQSGKSRSIVSLAEKELRVDTLELSHRFTEPGQVENRRNVLEKLNSDGHKLANLQITIQDLKQKVEITEKGKKGKEIEYDTTKVQLEETEEQIAKLFDVNRNLITIAENDGKSSEQLDNSENFIRQRKISEQADRASEKIGRLQTEVQKLQFQLLKLDNENKKSKEKVRITKSKVLLQDFLYGKTKSSSHKKRKKKNFCGCVKPPTKGDSENSY